MTLTEAVVEFRATWRRWYQVLGLNHYAKVKEIEKAYIALFGKENVQQTIKAVTGSRD